MQRLTLRRHRDDPSGARTALQLLTMIASDDELAQCTRSLTSCAANPPTSADFKAAADELRLAIQAQDEVS